MRKTIFFSLFCFSLVCCGPVSPTAPNDAILYVSANPTSIPVGGATSVVTVIGYESTGILLSNKTVIYFSTDIGSIDSSAEIRDGQAKAIFKSDSRSGIAHIYVTSGKVTATPFPLEILVGSAALTSLTIGANPTILPPGGGQSTIIAVAFDKSSNTLSGVPVVFTTDAGKLNSGGNVLYTNEKGEVGDVLTTKSDATVKVTSGTISASVKITVEKNLPPTAVFVYSPTAPKVTDTVNFNASSSSDSDGYIVSYKWDFGDGTSGQGVQTSHQYGKAGGYQVTLVVTDDKGATGAASQTVTVANVINLPPTAVFVFSPTSPKVSDTVNFNASGSSDSDGYIVSYTWDFGDGSSGTGAVISHKYAAAGGYKVTLVVTDDKGATGVTSQTVTVTAGLKIR